jgi:hypothetical protein
VSACGAGEQLPAEADAEERLASLERIAHEVVLAREPRVTLILVDVHGPAEDDERVEALGRFWRRPLGHVPLQEVVAALADDVGEEPGGSLSFVGQAEHLHAASVRKKERGSVVVRLLSKFEGRRTCS